MKKINQKFVIVFLVLALLFSSLVFLFSEGKEKVSAQDEGTLACHEPIGIGSALDATLEAMDTLVKETSNIHREVSNQIEKANAALASIGKDAANCDTSKETCQAMCVNAQAKITLKATLLWCITLVRYPACIAVCSFRQACSGKPCPALDSQVALITDSLAGIVKSIQKINDVFSSSTEQIEEDIIREEEVAKVYNCLNASDPEDCLLTLEVSQEAIDRYYQCENEVPSEPEDCRLELLAGLKGITKIEFAQRKLEKTRADFDKWRMSQEDWEKAYREEIIPKATVKCLEALEQRAYWPKWWTDDCEEHCKENPYSTDCQDCLCTGCESTAPVWPLPGPRCTDTGGTNSDPEKCQECLDQSPIHQYSWLKATGCKFYGACRSKCEKAVSGEKLEECLTCLCEGLLPDFECTKQGGTAEECKIAACQRWICGKSLLNWTGCHSY